MKRRIVSKTLAALAIASFVMLGRADAQAKTNELDIHSEKTLQDGSLYKGQMKDSKRHGIGTNFYPDGSRLDGAWYNDKPAGNVVVTYKDGSCFKGTYRQSEKNGLGVMINAEGKIETANMWENNEKAEGFTVIETAQKTYYVNAVDDSYGGDGIVAYENGDIYIGNLIGDKRYEEGKGTIYYSNGSWYTGDFKKGQPDGDGIFFGGIPNDKDLSIPYIKCAWTNGKKTGMGIWYQSDGSRVIGNFTDDGKKYDGLGVNIEPNGTVSVEDWENGSPKSNKPAVWKDSDGNTCSGSKVNGLLTGYGLCIYKKNVMIGNFEQGKLDGEGFSYLPDMDQCHIGSFKQGRLEGNGTIWYPVDSYKGAVKNGSLDGHGIYSFPNGSWTAGIFKENKPYSAVYNERLKNGGTSITIYENGQKKEGDAGVTMYKDADYSGVSAVFAPGKYNLADIIKRGISTKSISSIKIPDGYSVLIYTEDGCEGDCTRFRGNIDLPSSWKQLDDQTVSFVVEKE